MPALIISTNVSLDGVDTSSILSEATSEVAKLIGKPANYVMIVLKGSIPISLGGTQEPAAFGELVSIGGLGPDVNKNLSFAIASILEKKLSVPKSRLFLKFYDSQARYPLWMEWFHLLNPASFLVALQLNVGDSISYAPLVFCYCINIALLSYIVIHLGICMYVSSIFDMATSPLSAFAIVQAAIFDTFMFRLVANRTSVLSTEKMPCLNISTNVNLDGVNTSAILSEASSQVAKIIGKPESYVMIVLKGSVPIAFGGTEQPAAYGELVSVGGLSGDVNKKLSSAIATILESKLSVPKSRDPTLDGMVPPSKSSFSPELLLDLTPCVQTDVSVVFYYCRNLIT
ncbi:hypothetical protein D5086_012670 [Populus alba]|uniref:Uncharacterized protein n=1 Tax=Populus alba TaxID=43335 RepID=A0ACC4C3I7_POPAL